MCIRDSPRVIEHCSVSWVCWISINYTTWVKFLPYDFALLTMDIFNLSKVWQSTDIPWCIKSYSKHFDLKFLNSLEPQIHNAFTISLKISTVYCFLLMDNFCSSRNALYPKCFHVFFGFLPLKVPLSTTIPCYVRKSYCIHTEHCRLVY